MTLPIIAPIGAVSAAYALGEERGKTATVSMLIRDPIPADDVGRLREDFGEVTSTLAAEP